MTSPHDIIKRLEAASGPDRGLDRDIGLAIAGWHYQHTAEHGDLIYVPEDDCLYPDHPGAMYPHLTESLGAAIALVERMRPGWSWEARRSGFGNGQAAIWNPMEQPAPGKTVRADHTSSPAIALLLALFRALQEKQG